MAKRRYYYNGEKSVFGFLYVLIVYAFLSIIGWIIDIVHVAHVMITSNAPVTSVTFRFVLEIIGVFVPPWGGIMGWLHVFF